MSIGDRLCSSSPSVVNRRCSRQAVSVELQSAVHRNHAARPNSDVLASSDGHRDDHYLGRHRGMGFDEVSRDSSRPVMEQIASAVDLKGRPEPGGSGRFAAIAPTPTRSPTEFRQRCENVEIVA